MYHVGVAYSFNPIDQANFDFEILLEAIFKTIEFELTLVENMIYYASF